MEPQIRYIWDINNLEQIKESLCDEISIEYRNEFLNSMCSLDSTNKVAEAFGRYITQACQRVCRIKYGSHKRSIGKKCKWYDKECAQLRTRAISAGERVNSECPFPFCSIPFFMIMMI